VPREKIAPDRSSPERSRLDNLFPVKSAGAAPLAMMSAASTSARVISAETMSGRRQIDAAHHVLRHRGQRREGQG